MSPCDDIGLDKLLQVACLQVVEEANVFAAVLSSKRRQRNNQQPASKVKLARRIFDRPSYTNSTWWTMLQKGDCKIEGHPQNKVFRRRFSVPFTMFKSIDSEAREWITVGDKKMGDTTVDCVGTDGVPPDAQPKAVRSMPLPN